MSEFDHQLWSTFFGGNINALANYCPNDLGELHATARNKLKSAQKRPMIIAACWMQATLW